MIELDNLLKISFIESINELELLLNRGRISLITPVNAEVFVHALHNMELDKVLRETLSIVDGVGIQILIFKKLRKKIAKLSGSDVVFFLTEKAKRESKNILIVGGTEKENEGSVKKLLEISENKIEIVGYSPPFIKGQILPDNISQEIFSIVKERKISYIYLCLGIPKQEIWMHKNRKILEGLGVELCIALGGTCRFLSGIEKRAPKFISTVGLEWLYRLVKNPQRLHRVKFWLPKYLRLLLR